MNSAALWQSVLKTNSTMGLGVPNTSSGHKPVREAHAPRQGCWYSIIAVPRKQTANPSNRVPHRRFRGARVHEIQRRNSKRLRQKNQRYKAAKEPAEPGKA